MVRQLLSDWSDNSPHSSGETHVLQQNRHPRGDGSFPHANRQDDLWIDALGSLQGGEVVDIIWSERDSPVHDHDIIRSDISCESKGRCWNPRLGERPNVIDAGCCSSKRMYTAWYIVTHLCSRLFNQRLPNVQQMVDSRVKVVNLILSRKLGVFASRAASTLATIV
jgi:hypothetical protein